MNMLANYGRGRSEVAARPPAGCGNAQRSLARRSFCWRSASPSGTPLRRASSCPSLPTVTVASPLVRPIAEWDDYSGRFEASKSVEVRPRVSGAIVGVHFTDGADRPPGAAAVHDRPAAVRQPHSTKRAPRWRAPAATLRSRKPTWPGDAAARSRCGLAQRRRPAARAGSGSRGRAGRGAGPGPIARARRRLHPGPRADHAAAFRTAGSMPAISCRAGAAVRKATLLTTINALDPIYFTLRRLGSAVPEGPARARNRRRAVRRRDPAAGRGRLSLARPARLHRQWTRHAVGNDPAARGGRQSDPVPDARHVRQHAPVDQRRPCRAARARCRGADRPGAQDRARRRPRTAASRRGRSTLGPVVDGLRVVRSGLTTADRVIISGTQIGDARDQGAGPRRQDRCRMRPPPRPIPRPSAQRRSDPRRN